MKWDYEESVKQIMLHWLDKKGYTYEVPKTDTLHGVDIRRQSPVQRRYWFIEVKGAPQDTYQKGKRKGTRRRTRSQFSQRYIWFVSALGQIALRMEQEHGNYGIALPDMPYNRKFAMRVRLFRKRAKVHFFLVDKTKRVSQLTPGSAYFKRV